MHQSSQDALMGLEGKRNTGDPHFAVQQLEIEWNMDSLIPVGLFQHRILRFYDIPRLGCVGRGAMRISPGECSWAAAESLDLEKQDPTLMGSSSFFRRDRDR